VRAECGGGNRQQGGVVRFGFGSSRVQKTNTKSDCDLTPPPELSNLLMCHMTSLPVIFGALGSGREDPGSHHPLVACGGGCPGAPLPQRHNENRGRRGGGAPQRRDSDRRRASRQGPCQKGIPRRPTRVGANKQSHGLLTLGRREGWSRV
jgi:hypothetical protein